MMLTLTRDAEVLRMPARVRAAFERYCALGPQRSIQRTAAATGVNPASIARWSARYQWVSAAAEWELAQSRTRDEEMRAQQLAVEYQLYELGRELHQEAARVLREQLTRGKPTLAAVQALQETRAEWLRGLRLPERITRQEMTGDGGGAMQMEVRGDVGLDWDGFQRAFGELLAGGARALPADVGADGGAESLDSAHADGAAGALPEPAGD